MEKPKKTVWMYTHIEHGQRVEAGPYATREDADKASQAHARACPRSKPSEPIEVPSDYVIL
jgi:hypothetical protein